MEESTSSKDWNRMRMPLFWMANEKMRDNIGNRRSLRLLNRKERMEDHENGRSEGSGGKDAGGARATDGGKERLHAAKKSVSKCRFGGIWLIHGDRPGNRRDRQPIHRPALESLLDT